MSGDDVVVIGAGMAGLSCARVLAEAGLRVTVLEASERVGGRIRTVRDGEVVVELGAEFVHGRPEELWSLIEEAGLETYERVGEFMTPHAGRLQAQSDEEDEVLEGLKEFSGPDCSFAEYVGRLGLSDEERQAELGYVEGFNAADAREASVLALGIQQRAEDTIEGDRMWRLTEGYEENHLVFARARGGGGWTGGAGGRGGTGGMDGITRRRAGSGDCAEGWESVRGRCLRGDGSAGCVAGGRSPVSSRGGKGDRGGEEDAYGAGLPVHDGLSAAALARGGEFPLRAGCGAEGLVDGSAGEGANVDWVDGRTGVGSAAGLDEGELRERAIEVAAAALLVSGEEVCEALMGFHTHDWTADPCTRGAYSWVPVGGLQASREMSEPIEDTLFFAGEHTDVSGHWGTVHAALRSGLRAASQVLELHAARS